MDRITVETGSPEFPRKAIQWRNNQIVTMIECDSDKRAITLVLLEIYYQELRPLLRESR